MAASTSTPTTTMASLVGLPNANAIQKPWQLPTLKPSSKPLQNNILMTCCALNSKPTTDAKESIGSKKRVQRGLIGAMAAALLMMGFTSDAEATRIEYYATVAEPSCELTYVPSGLGYCDILPGTGPQAPYGELIDVHYTARFADETVFDSSYKRGRPLTMRIGVGKVIRGLDQGIFGGGGVPAMQVGGKRKLRIPPELAYGSEPAGCFSASVLQVQVSSILDGSVLFDKNHHLVPMEKPITWNKCFSPWDPCILLLMSWRHLKDCFM